MQKIININLPLEIFLALREDENKLSSEIKKLIAVKYFKEKRLSLGQAAELAGMSIAEFIQLLSEQNISVFNFDCFEEIKEDVKNA
ncbi:hypothetical protein Calkro_2041 [Caldicellulosiruptor kronotskyensis 2002]|jgi:predicted HTH domain antitoxin|uniref:Uncharacterized protein n=3 Tax=Caldicellulosiruptor TaxID=44000 RepID=E4SGK9_CALK2|nr:MULTISPECIES: UPF0175 family protein [Caldicellulosiruptor]ADQ41485.1 hypothetical protein Calkr_2013 [Caldicellulosiruptor acetigenus I77R1B]ADQ46884.1 hypothetical protein Calkro_2041 [Caldicellulosiruptor kronotskyensis 2002]AEM73015.1 protein of unknown function UPF0175 [Caldicellulosiruptor acetigenus 6A]WAM35728.1 UPF0175 family protein [Caldicellulosiruptor acetigenus]